MFLGLDKLYNQEVKKVIVTVPERSMSSSFAGTELTSHEIVNYRYDHQGSVRMRSYF